MPSTNHEMAGSEPLSNGVGVQEPGRQSVGIVSCTSSHFHARGVGLAFIVQAPFALILDTPDLSAGNIIGVLCAADVAVPSRIDGPWIELPFGSFMRHPKVRTGRIRSQKQGWMIAEHKDFGCLLRPFSITEVERCFIAGLFIKLPFVKLSGSAVASKARADANNSNVLGSEVVDHTRNAAANVTSLPPSGDKPHGTPSGHSSNRKDIELNANQASAMLDELLNGYTSETFQRASKRLDQSWDLKRDRFHRMDDVDELCVRVVSGSVIERYGFVGNTSGMKKATSVVQRLAQVHVDVMEKHRRIQKIIFASFPSCFGMLKAEHTDVNLRLFRGSARDDTGTAVDALDVRLEVMHTGAPYSAHTHSEQGQLRAPDVIPDVQQPLIASSGREIIATATTDKSSSQASEVQVHVGAKGKGMREQALWRRAQRLPEESFGDHCSRCEASHYQVAHRLVFVREWCSTTAEQINVCYKDCCICTDIVTNTVLPTSEGEWVQCGSGAKFWRSTHATCPEMLLSGPPLGYILKQHPVHGVLIKPLEGAALRAIQDSHLMNKDPEDTDANTNHGKVAGVVEADPSSDPCMGDHWVVEAGQQLEVFEHCTDKSKVVCFLMPGDALVLGSQPPDLQWVGLKCWLRLDVGANVYRGGVKVCIDQAGFVLAVDEGVHQLRQSADTTAGTVLRFLTGYGEPWVVAHEQVVVRSGPSIKSRAVGVLMKGDLVGVKALHGDWVQLVRDASVRGKVTRAARQAVYSISETRTIKVEPVRAGSRYTYASFSTPTLTHDDQGVALWMMVNHPELGRLLNKWDGVKIGLGSGCVLTEERRGIYIDVINLCHRRIYEENIDILWGGERDKLPTPQTLEAKLFDADTTVIHATMEGHFAGGAIVKKLCVRAHSGEGGINVGMATAQQSHNCPGHTCIGYVDSCAAEPGFHAGSAIWQSVAGMRFVCVACHSILLQSTVKFWQARGLRRYEPTSRQDCEDFASAILMRTQGTVKCELADLQRALPASKLPLFIWIPRSVGEMDMDPQDFVFSPDCPDPEVAR